MHFTLPALPFRKVLLLVVVLHCCSLPARLRKSRPPTRIRSTVWTSSARRCSRPIRQIAANAGVDASIVVGKVLDKNDAEVRL
jgi:chaperonin GroEL (HSP60 family)